MQTRLILGDKNPEMIDGWQRTLSGVPDVIVSGGNFLMTSADALVSPANK